MSNTTNASEDVSGPKNKITELHRLIKIEKARADRAEREREDAADEAAQQAAERGGEMEAFKAAPA